MAKMNIKKAAFDHVEKVVFGIIMLVAVLALAGTNWVSYKGTPNDITSKIEQGRKTLKANTWPQADQAEYALTDEEAPRNVVHVRLFEELSPAEVEMSGKLVVDVFGGNEPVREPALVAPQYPIASSSRVFIHLADAGMDEESETEPEDAKTEEPEEEEESIPDEFRRRRQSLAAGMGPEGAGMDGELSYAAAAETDESLYVDYGAMSSGMMSPEGIPLEGDMLEGEMSTAPVLNGKGYHFVSVRAVFPLREQIMKYAEAIHKSYHTAAMSFDIRDFELERQTAQPGADRWSGPWQKVDLQVARDVLASAYDFDADVVSSVITNAVITMPLPMRITGEWRNQATHPRIEKFELSDKQIALEMEMQRKLLEEAVSRQKEMEANVVKRGGFSSLTFDARQLQQDVMGIGMYDMGYSSGMGMGGESMGMDPGLGMGVGFPGSGRRGRSASGTQDTMQKLIQDMAKDSTDPKEEERRIREWIQSQVSAAGELLLFRYLDFNVEPGKTYRYRIRLELANPNFGKRVADAGGLPHVVEGETRLTPWSPETEPVTVEEDVRYFVAGLDYKAGRVLPIARFDVYEWSSKFGTFVNSMLDIQLGQRFAENVKTTVIDPAKSTYEEDDYPFTSRDFLVDAIGDIKIDEAFHESGELAVKLPTGSQGRLHLPTQALVKEGEGRLAYLQPGYQAADHKKYKKFMEMQADQFEDLKKKEEAPEDLEALAELGLAPEEYAGEMGMESSGIGRRTRSSLKKRTR